MAFVLRDNLLYLRSATVDGRPGRFLFGSANPQSVLDAHFAQAVLDLRGVADAIIGADVWGAHAVTIDYRAGLLTFQREGIHPDLMNVYSFRDAPSINVAVDGRLLPAIVDTSSPDTLVLPRAAAPSERRTVRVQIAGADLGEVSVRLAEVATPRIGNRLLSKFLVTIDYGQREVGLWRDPRTGL